MDHARNGYAAKLFAVDMVEDMGQRLPRGGVARARPERL